MPFQSSVSQGAGLVSPDWTVETDRRCVLRRSQSRPADAVLLFHVAMMIQELCTRDL